MKYKNGNIVCLNNGKTVYIISVDEKTKEYQALDTESEGELLNSSESEIFMLLTQLSQLEKAS